MAIAPTQPRYSQEGESRELEERLRSLVEEGRISEAQALLETSGDLVPEGSKIREVLSPPRVTRSDKRDVDRTAEFRWLKTHAASHQGKWVALVGENLVASSDSLKELLAQLARLRFERQPLIHHLL
jgi:hypothetical protein